MEIEDNKNESDSEEKGEEESELSMIRKLLKRYRDIFAKKLPPQRTVDHRILIVDR